MKSSSPQDEVFRALPDLRSTAPTQIDFRTDSRQTSSVPSGPEKECHWWASAQARNTGAAMPVKISAWGRSTTSTSQPHFWHQRRTLALLRIIKPRSVSMVICIFLWAVFASPSLYPRCISCYSAAQAR
jgi:hypothetical protein